LKTTGRDPVFTNEDYNTHVDGVPRYNGAQNFLLSKNIVLPFGNPQDPPWHETDRENTTICAVGNRKDQMFEEELNEKGAKIYESTVSVIRELKQRGVLLGVGSSSKNCTPILKQCGLLELFDSVVDGVTLEQEDMKGKPNPDMFLRALELAWQNAGKEKISPEFSMLSEDATSGVAAGKAGRFGLVVGVNRAGVRDALFANGADIVIDDFSEVSIARIDQWYVRAYSLSAKFGTEGVDSTTGQASR